MLWGYGLLTVCAIGMFALIVPALDMLFDSFRSIDREDNRPLGR